MSTLKVNTIQDTTGNDAISIGSDGSVGFVQTQMSHRNLIINGAMQVAQRGTSAFTPSAQTYTLDRWFAISDPGSKFTVQQNAGSVTPPVGFSKYLGVTSTSAHTLGANDYNFFDYRFEGQDTVSLAWGTSNAKDITVSFWVRSSLTGQFSFIVYNAASGGTKRYAATYTVSSANTWEYKTVTIPGDTTESWGSDNGYGMILRFNLGTGSTYGSATANAWQTGTQFGTSGDNSIVSTNGATWYITGVQLEVGSVATPFEHRSYGEELARCQRYYQQWGGNASYERVTVGFYHTTSQVRLCVPLHPEMRTAPSLSVSAHSDWLLETQGTSNSNTNHTLDSASPKVASINVTTTLTSTAGYCGQLLANGIDARLKLDAEL